MKRTNLFKLPKTLFHYCTLFGAITTIALSLNTTANAAPIKIILSENNPKEVNIEKLSKKQQRILLNKCRTSKEEYVKFNGKKVYCKSLNTSK